jgi:hypothetical protein
MLLCLDRLDPSFSCSVPIRLLSERQGVTESERGYICHGACELCAINKQWQRWPWPSLGGGAAA